MLQLFHAPMACSLAVRLALVEAGLPHEVNLVLTWRGESKADSYLAINPRGQVPALQTPDGLLTEVVAILAYIADQVPDRHLLPGDSPYERARGLSALSYLSTTVHGAYSLLFAPKAGADTEVAKAGAIANLNKVLGAVDAMLDGRDHVLDAFSLTDILLFVLSLWRRAPALSGALAHFPNLDRFEAAIFQRPGVAEIIQGEMKLRFSE